MLPQAPQSIRERIAARLEAWVLSGEDQPDGAAWGALLQSLIPYAAYAIRRHGIQGVIEPEEAVSAILVVATEAKNGRVAGMPRHIYYRRKVEKCGLEITQRALQRSVRNVVWNTHAASDPTGAVAFRAVGVALRCLAEASVPGLTVDAGLLHLGDEEYPPVIAVCLLALELERIAREGSGIHAWDTSLKGDKLGRRLADWLRRLHASLCASGCSLPVTVRALTAVVRQQILGYRETTMRALSQLADDGQRVLRGGAPERKVIRDDAAPAWGFEELPTEVVKKLLRGIGDCLECGMMMGQRLYAARRGRMREVFSHWLACEQFVDPRPMLVAMGVAKTTVYADRQMLHEQLLALWRELRREEES
jgi:hypothetical protein